MVIGRRLHGVGTGLLAALLYLVSEGHSWAFLNLSELPCVLFALCAISVGLRFRAPAYEIELARPFWFGACLSLSVLSRAMAVLLVGAIALLPLLHEGRWERVKRNWLPVLAGGAVPVLVIGAYFAAVGTLRALLYWCFTYNSQVHGHPALISWIGDLHVPGIQEIWRFNLGGLLLVLAGLNLAARNRNAGLARALAVSWLPALGGWLGANPSGLTGMAFHAIPAFPFLSLGLASSVMLLWTARTTGGRWYGAALRGCAVAVLVLATYPMLANTVRVLAISPVSPEYTRTARIGSYIAAHTSPHSRMFMFGADPLVYVAAHRNSATEFSIVCGDMRGYEDRILKELQHARPETVIFNKGDAWYHSNLSDFPKVAAYIVNNYRVSRQFDDVLFQPSAEATEHVVLAPEDLAKFQSSLVNYRWRPVQDILPVDTPQLLSFAREGDWGEVYLPHAVNFQALGSARELLLEMKVLVSGPPHSYDRYPLRILFWGRDGLKLNQFCSAWVPLRPDSKVATIHLPLTDLALCHGDFSWSEVTGVQIGSSGPAGGKVVLYSLEALRPGEPGAAHQ